MARGRAFQPEFKAQVVLEDLTGVQSVAEICREHSLSPQVLSCWKAEFLERAPEIFATERCRGDEQERLAKVSGFRCTSVRSIGNTPPVPS